MLQTLVSILNGASPYDDSGTLYCRNYNISDLKVIDYIVDNELLENLLTDKKIGDKVDLEFSLVRLNSVGYYHDSQTFVFNNRYSKPVIPYFIKELNSNNSDSSEFINTYNAVVDLIESIKSIAKHSYLEVNVQIALLFREDKSAFISFEYDASDIKLVDIYSQGKLKEIVNVYFESDTEKKLLYINELIDFIHSSKSENQFKYLLAHIGEFQNKCYNAYLFYLRDFSYNKLKFEIDSKALDYTQKVQTVINDAQTKLIAIPTAFAVVVAALDFSELVSTKNLAAIGGLFIFSALLQLFINNQKSTLAFIKESVDAYKESFKDNAIEKISGKFVRVDNELDKQINRLWQIQFALWLMPFSLLILWFVLLGFMIPAIGAVILFLVMVAKLS